MTLSDLIQEYRRAHSLSQRQFASACGLSNGYISMLEKNENPKTGQPVTPSLPALKKISDGMGLSLHDLLSNIDDIPVDLLNNSSGAYEEKLPSSRPDSWHNVNIATTADRLKQIMAQRNLKQTDILRMAKPYCEKYNIKMGKSDLSQFVNGKVEPGQWKLTILGLALNVSEAWLMGLDVPMERKTTPVSLEEDGHNVNVVKIAGRDGRFIEKELNDKQLQALIAFVDLLPDASDDL